MEKTHLSTPAQHGAHETRAARGATGKTGAAQDGVQPAAPGDGFALLLAALGGDLGSDLGSALGSEAGSEAGDALASVLPAAQVQQDTPAATGLPPPDLQTALLAGLQPGAFLGGAPAGLAGAEPDALAARMGLGLVRPGQDTLVGQTAQLDAGGHSQEPGRPAGRFAAAPAGRGGLPRGLASALDAVGAPSAALGVGGGKLAAEAGLERAAAATTQVTQGLVMGPVMVQATGLAGRRDGGSAAAQPAAELAGEPAAPAAGVAAVGAAGAMAGAALGGDAWAAPRGGDAAAGQGLEPQSPSVADAAEAMPDAAQAGMASTEDQLAEQVAYWVHQKTQNAELTLDQGGQPVEVKVTLTGDEAHVTFRSDQAEARQLLDTGAAELRAMLQREGLQLAGVTVGMSGGGGDPSRQGGRDDGRRGARQASVQAATPAGQGAHARGGVGERSVDIFV
ncbi:flagellar hook-length control protein FliK [Diaphorobacter sp.]|uniref:flagellar hook-length control protein FliK n=1 Tax=Diaphorobacter sp. TaxID=1934310 RepID=UPI003D1385A9